MMTEFDPVRLNLAENAFLIAHAGEPPVVALQRLTPGVNKAAVKPVLEGLYELIELEKHEQKPWIGLEPFKDACRTYLAQSQEWAKNKGRKGAPRFPSMHSFDSRGRPHLSGVGSDSGQVRTYFDGKGTRHPFAISLQPMSEEAWAPEWITKNAVIKEKELVINNDAHRIECFCGHTEKFNPESRSSYNAARARMSRHLRKAIDNVDDHRALHTAEFS